MSRKCVYCDSVLTQGQDTCPNCGAPYEQKKPSAPVKPPKRIQPPANSLGVQSQSMGWHKALVGFGLYLYAALLAFRGITYSVGKAYVGLKMVDEAYTLAPMLKPADLLYGSLLFGGALFALKVRERLKEHRKNGPLLLHFLLGAVIVATIGYLMGSSAAVEGTALAGVYPATSGMVWELVFTGIVLVCDVVYYRNRKALFAV